MRKGVALLSVGVLAACEAEKVPGPPPDGAGPGARRLRPTRRLVRRSGRRARLQDRVARRWSHLGRARRLLLRQCHARGGLSRFLDLRDPAVAARVRLPRSFISSELRGLEITDLSLGFGDFASIAEVLDRPQRHLMWSASTDAQVSWTSAEYLTGAFTTVLDRRLRSEPGSPTFAQVHRLVHDDVVAHTTNHPSGDMELQNPQLRGDRQSMTIDEFFRQR